MRKLLLILPALLFLSCSRPSSTETFLRGGGPYVFTVDMSDSLATYDVDLFTRIDAMEFPAQLRLDITWKDPLDSLFTETVYLPVSRGSSFFSQESYTPYRADVAPAVPGLWSVTVAVLNPPEGLNGMGLVLKKH